jgi:hypothetical protein
VEDAGTRFCDLDFQTRKVTVAGAASFGEIGWQELDFKGAETTSAFRAPHFSMLSVPWQRAEETLGLAVHRALRSKLSTYSALTMGPLPVQTAAFLHVAALQGIKSAT